MPLRVSAAMNLNLCWRGLPLHKSRILCFPDVLAQIDSLCRLTFTQHNSALDPQDEARIQGVQERRSLKFEPKMCVKVVRTMYVSLFFHQPPLFRFCDLSRRTLSQDQMTPRRGARMKTNANIIVAIRTIEAPEEMLT